MQRGGGSAGSDRLTGHVDRLLRGMALLSGTVLLGLVALTVVDVALRYVFNTPLFGGQDFAELGLLTVVALAIAYCGRAGGHVAVDLIGAVVRPSTLRVLDTVVRLMSAAIVSVIVWRCITNGLDAADYGEASNLLNIPYLPFYFLLAFGFAAYVVVLVLEAFAAIAPPGEGH